MACRCLASYQKVDYKYNIRGWLKEINDVDSNADSDLFAFKINYNEGTNPLYNGNISETYWKSESDNVLRKYEYHYDNLNRLLLANYSKPLSTTIPSAFTTNSYLEKIGYDKNGNITSLVRNGDLDSNDFAIEIDDLVYTYDANNKNKLLKVFDQSNHPQGFKDDSNGITDPADDYEYDVYGNLIKDTNKEIANITYNHLNLPSKITFVNETSIEYIYNAVGQKVRKIVRQLDVTNTDYMGGFQYVAGKLNFFPHAEGYVNVTVGRKGAITYNYVYQYKDHLGNNRLSYTIAEDQFLGQPTQLTILEENHYYPFGLKHTSYNTTKYEFVEVEDGANYYINISQLPAGYSSAYKYKYNGKEYQDELGLNVTAMDFRMYDNALGRFHNIDKMTDIMPSLSPYRFAFNNPVLWSDPTGLLENGGGDEEIKTIYFSDVVIIGHRKSNDQRPASFNYSLINWSLVDNRKRPTLEQYNKYHGTNYSSFDDYYYNEHYKPAQKKMIQKRNQAGKTVIGTLLVMGTAGVGTAYALPFAAACSPAIQSTVATLVTNPTVVSIQSFMYGGMSEYAGANMLANAIGQGVGNGGDVTEINILEVAGSGFNGLIPVVIGGTFNISLSDVEVNNKTKISAGIGTSLMGNIFKNKFQLPKSIMTNASFATYQGMINTSIDASSTFTTNQINDKYGEK